MNERSFVLTRARQANYPGVLMEIVQMIGEEATGKLIAQYGGTSVYIPVTPKADSVLCGLIGLECVQKLSKEFSGLVVEIPRAVGLLLGRRNELIRKDRAAGMSTRSLAIKYQLTQRSIRTITTTERKHNAI